jgi:arginyl-tRNA synthetase
VGKRLLIEFSSPNTNKPQHLGHVRNNLLGASVANLSEHAGFEVIRTNLVNDRGIHICKSMVAYRRFGEGRTPAELGIKGDHYVGDLYVQFETALRAEYAAYTEAGGTLEREAWFNTEDSSLGSEARAMLVAWEEGDPDVRALWQTMNGWVFEGFAATYERMGIRFEWVQKESETYLLGKELVQEGLAKSVFTRRPDGAVVCDLTQLDQKGVEGAKVLLRADGTSVYMTQDLGTAKMRLDERAPDRMVYVVANEQDHHFKVLFGVLDLLEPGLGARCHHLSYGMVNLPHGRMKSREGTVVDADELMDELHRLAAVEVERRYPELDAAEKATRAERIGLAGLKFFLLRFSPQSAIKYDPEASISFDGETGPYLLYTYARSRSILRKAGVDLGDSTLEQSNLARLSTPEEHRVSLELLELARVLPEAAASYDPSRLCSQLYLLARAYNGFQNSREHQVVGVEPELEAARLTLVAATGAAMKMGLSVLGIETLEEM